MISITLLSRWRLGVAANQGTQINRLSGVSLSRGHRERRRFVSIGVSTVGVVAIVIVLNFVVALS